MRETFPLQIGVSACFLPPEPSRPAFSAKTLLYLEQSLAHWIQSKSAPPYRAMPWLIPTRNSDSAIPLQEYVDQLDGLVLHGGADVSPQTYGETPLRPEWGGDTVRDAYEIELFHAFLKAQKPILGICRGAQLMNVALGGTLYQDLPTQFERAGNHKNRENYDLNCHTITLEPTARHLGVIYPHCSQAKVTAIHHQGIRNLGKNLVIEAKASDGVIEAIRLESEVFVLGVQWHPEFHDAKRQGPDILPSTPLLAAFLKAAHSRKESRI